ncbi:hypothetical protein [Archangium sp.]|jgi:hypothetical protein|uniref:hypothetical protein n=1 Tax=Archangium sp. TaxID=1872627 RepID=UPI002ED7849A
MIRLERNIDVRTFDVEATVAVGRDRPEFLAVARLAADLRRPVDGRTIARELLGGLPEQTGWRVLDRCVALGLLEQQGDRGPAVLSESGARALEQGAVLVPEEGVWRFYLVEDPLVDVSLVHVARLEAQTAKDERNALYEAKREGASRPTPGAPLPGALAQPALVRRFLTSIATGKGFELRHIARRGESGPSGTLRLILEWPEASPPQLILRGQLPQDGQDARSRVDHRAGTPAACASIPYDGVWRALLIAARGVQAAELARWHDLAGHRVLPVAFDDGLRELSRRTMRLDVDVPPTNMNPLGRFDATRLGDVQVVPRSDADAQAWAEWLQWDALDRYATPAWLTKMAEELTRRFPYHRPRLPNSSALLNRALRAPMEPRARFLLAPADLGLWS